MNIWKKFTTFFKDPAQKKERDILINVLTRTSGRPVGFEKCFSSIDDQTYSSIRHIVSYDTPEDLSYLKGKKLDLIRVKKKTYKGRLTRKGHKLNFEPYNLYCNRLLRKVNHGWVLFLDDDDMLAKETVLKDLTKVIENVDKDTLLIFQTEYPDGRKLPDDDAFKVEKIEYMNIDTACFAFHSKYKKAVKWDAWRGADFRYIRDLAKEIPNQVWIKDSFTKKNNFGDQGRRNDLKI